VEEAKTKRKGLAAVWLDFWNAFGSIPDGDLDELSESLPLPGTFQQILHDIYKENNVDFVVGKKIVRIIPIVIWMSFLNPFHSLVLCNKSSTIFTKKTMWTLLLEKRL